jgi:hypothetical protein
MSESERNPLVSNLTAKNAVVAQQLIGDVVINPIFIQQHHEVKRKIWRELIQFDYPSQTLDHDLSGNYAAHLIVQLHRTFRDTGYTEFTSLISLATKSVMDNEVWVISLLSHQAKFVGAIHSAVRVLWNANPDRAAFQEALNDELRQLFAQWNIHCELSRDRGPVAYRFIYDPDGRSISIRPHDQPSTQPSDYPQQLAITSELLVLCSAVLNSANSSLLLGDIGIAQSSYSLTKLILHLLDSHSLELRRIRVNVNEPEEWDYLNPDADIEFGKHGIGNEPNMSDGEPGLKADRQ